jgi:hypothetical protein
VTGATGAAANVATDTIWDASGDIAVGTGADAAARLARGTPGQSLIPNATTLTWISDPRQGSNLSPTGALFENMSRTVPMAGSATASGTLRMTSIWLPAGLTVTNIVIVNGATAEAGGSNAWAALFDSSRNLLRQSTSETGAGAIAASVIHTFALSSTFVTTYSGLHYVGVNVVASTMPSIFAVTVLVATYTGLAPILCGNTTDTGLTGTAPNPAGAITAATTMMYCYVT